MSNFINTSKWFSVVPLLALVMLLIGWSFNRSPQMSKNTYKNDTAKVSFNYNNEWMSARTEAVGVLAEYKILANPQVQMQVRDLNKYMFSYKSSHEQYNKATFKNFNKLKDADTKVAGKEAYRLDYSYSEFDDKGKEVIMFATDVLIPREKNIVLLRYAAPEADFAKYEKNFDNTLESVTLN
ncbi:MAG: hypothetical protein H7Y04_12625 [Verrucomicrobia bacterium]|nr:hypothetical protein [Cytophagales bacterium]